MSGSPTNVNLNDVIPSPKPDSCNVEWQAGQAYPDPNSPGAYIRDTAACYRYPFIGGVFVIDDTTFVSPYLLSSNDSGQILVVNAAAAFTLTLPSTAPAFASPAQGVWNVMIINIGSSTVTLNRNTRNIDGAAANLTLEQFQAITLSTDGTDYWSGIKASGFVGGVVANTGTSVTLGNTHHQKLLTTSNGSSIAVTLDSTVGKGFIAWHVNLGAGTATLTPSSGTINGAANLAVSTGSGCTLFFDGTNWEAVIGGGGGGGFTNPMTTLGDIIYEDATPTAARLAGNTTSTKKFLRQTGTGSISAVPAWDVLVAGDIPSLDASKITTGQLALARGGTGVDLSASGGTTKILAQDGSHVISARDLIAADIPNIAESQVTSLVSDLALLAPLASPALTGTPTAPTATGGTNTTQIATTAFVQAAIPSVPVSSVFGRTGAVVAVAGDYGVDKGGTGQTSYTKGDLLAAAGSTTLNKLAVGTDGQVLTADAASTNGIKWSTEPYDVAMFFPGTQQTASQVISRIIPPRAVAFAAGLSPSTATAITAATGSTVFSVQKNGVQFGTITFAAAGTSGTFAAASSSSFNGTSDVLSVIGPATPDSSLADIGIILSGTR